MIELYHISNINEVDTPYFKSKSDQEYYFSQFRTYKDTDAYYPPYYFNTIKLSTDDFTLNQEEINYCCITFEGRRYYYFVNDIQYINESLFSISLEMDTIQTYMYDMRITSPTITRMPIDRYVDGNINRDYIRENLSTGNLKKVFKENISKDKLSWLIIYCSDVISDLTPKNINTEYPLSTYQGKIVYEDAIQAKTKSINMSGGVIYALPISEDILSTGVYDISIEGVTYDCLSVQDTIEYFASNSNVNKIVYVPYNLFTDIEYGYSSSNKDLPRITVNPQRYSFALYSDGSIGLSFKYYHFVPVHKNYNRGLIVVFPYIHNIASTAVIQSYLKTKNEGLHIQAKHNEITLDNIKENKSKGIPYSSNYIPCMIDETYIRYNIGDTSNYTIVPLYYNNTNTFEYEMISSITGTMIYTSCFDGLLKDFGDAFIDTYNTLLVNTNAMELSLYTNPWKQYQVSHRGSIITDWLSTGLGATATGLNVASRIVGTTNGNINKEDNGVNFANTTVTTQSCYLTGFARYRSFYQPRDAKGRFMPRQYVVSQSALYDKP